MKYFLTEYGRSVVTIAVIIIATIANALADATMIKMGFNVGDFFQILDWSRLQWVWHICKWIFFNGALGTLAIMNIGIRRTFYLGVLCFAVWEIIYMLAK